MSAPRWAAPTATFTLLASGTAALAVAATLALSGTADSSPSGTATPGPSVTPQVPAPAAQAPAPAEVPDTDAAGVSGLADPAWVTRAAKATGIPDRALAAYAGAALATARTYPGCGLGWNTLAAIGLVESEHGTLNGARLGADGNSTPPIIGVALDGTGHVAKVPDTEHGTWDGDRTWDRALGPMQFTPATWRAHALDGNGDGSADLHNIDDAALSAAGYLCSAGTDLTQPENWITAIAAYNTGSTYNQRVAEAATEYATAAGG